MNERREQYERRETHRRVNDPPTRRFEWSTLSVGLAFLIQFALIVAWSARTASALDTLRDTQLEIKSDVRDVKTQVDDTRSRLRVVESKVDDLRDNDTQSRRK